MTTVRRSKQVSSEDLKEFLESYFAETDVNPSGDISYKAWDFVHLYELLPDAFELHPDFTRRQTQRILHDALVQCRKANECNEQALLKHAENLAKSRLAKNPQRFTMWTKFRARQMSFAPPFHIVWNGVRLRSSSGLPKYLRLQDYFLSGYGQIEPNAPSFYGHIITTCEARDEDNAVHKMLDALQLFYGLVNLYARWGQHTMWSGTNWTDGPLWLGPYQFAFRGKKFLGTERVWYNPDYVSGAWERSPLDMTKVHKLLPKVRKALSALDTHPLRDVIVKAVLLFQDGFAARDGSHRLLRYWTALEQLYSDDPRNRNQQRIIQRASFAEPSPALERWKLNHAAQLRNGHVHAGDPTGDVDASAEHLRLLLSRHINHLIFVRGDLKRHSDWLELVDLPTTLSKLTSKKDLIEKRLTYLT